MLSSMLAVSLRPSRQAGFSTTFRGERRDSHMLLYSTSSEFIYTTSSIHAAGKIVKDDCVRSCLMERESLLLSNSQIGAVHCILMDFQFCL